MLFNSFEFIIFYLPVTIFIFYFLGKRSQEAATLWLVIASFLFYGWWDYVYVPLLFGSICFNYFMGKSIERSNNKKRWLTAGIVGNVLLLGYFKYMGFFVENINQLYDENIIEFGELVLPLGISFFTFTQTAYLVDAYRGETKNDNFVTYCEFVTIFPHLIAGPIINHKKMIPQFVDPNNFKVNYENMATGITIFSMGLFKKAVIADTISPWVGEVFGRPDNLTFMEAWIGTIGYATQLYFDFSGYSEMAIGLGLMLNMEFPINFNSPYKSASIIDFWRRWHMTLGTWVKDYLYIPMGGNRQGELSKMKNLFVSMLIIGFWHGAGWTYILWGALHGIALTINHQWRRLHIELPHKLCWFMTFSFVTLALVIFRAESLHDAMQIFTSLTDVFTITAKPTGLFSVNVHQVYIWLTVFTIMATRGPNVLELVKKRKNNKMWAALVIVMLMTSMFYMTDNSEFLYFQF